MKSPEAALNPRPKSNTCTAPGSMHPSGICFDRKGVCSNAGTENPRVKQRPYTITRTACGVCSNMILHQEPGGQTLLIIRTPIFEHEHIPNLHPQRGGAESKEALNPNARCRKHLCSIILPTIRSRGTGISLHGLNLLRVFQGANYEGPTGVRQKSETRHSPWAACLVGVLDGGACFETRSLISCQDFEGPTLRLHSSSFLGFIFRIL